MARKGDLRLQRENTVINKISSAQEKELTRALNRVIVNLEREFVGIKLYHEQQWKLKDVVAKLLTSFPEIDFHYHFESSSMRPDGGILSMISSDGKKHPILITEKKNQGTNDLRAEEGKPKQAKGNAIERLGKNVIGFRTAMKMESIFPFVCFGDGCDFDATSSILDRVVTIAQFGHLNKEYLHNIGGGGEFDRGTFYFREMPWTEDEMANLAGGIARKSVYYYFSKYGKENFV
jgi:type II restriction enzyme